MYYFENTINLSNTILKRIWWHKSCFLKSTLLPNFAFDDLYTGNKKIIIKIIFQWCLNRYYSMILIWCYYLVLRFSSFFVFFHFNIDPQVDFPAVTICAAGSSEDVFHAALLREAFTFFQTHNISVGITPIEAAIALYRKAYHLFIYFEGKYEISSCGGLGGKATTTFKHSCRFSPSGSNPAWGM